MPATLTPGCTRPVLEIASIATSSIRTAAKTATPSQALRFAGLERCAVGRARRRLAGLGRGEVWCSEECSVTCAVSPCAAVSSSSAPARAGRTSRDRLRHFLCYVRWAPRSPPVGAPLHSRPVCLDTLVGSAIQQSADHIARPQRTRGGCDVAHSLPIRLNRRSSPATSRPR